MIQWMLVTVVLLSSAGVHCTHGFNRTGFLICAYLVEKMDWRSENTHDHTEHMHSNSWGWAGWYFTTLWVILYYSHGIYHVKQHFASSFCVTVWEASLIRLIFTYYLPFIWLNYHLKPPSESDREREKIHYC